MSYTADRPDRQQHDNRISQKHVDFLICTRDTVLPLGVVELDDASHQRADRKQRDRFVDAAFAAAALHVMRVRAARSYDADMLRQQVLILLEDLGAPAPVPYRAADGPREGIRQAVLWVYQLPQVPGDPCDGELKEGTAFVGCPRRLPAEE
jgi:hypothetical protein